MKKLILSLSLALAIFATQAATITQFVYPGTMTNVLGIFGGLAKVTQITASATTITNGNIQLVDSYTNLLVYPSQPYTNTVSYATNGLQVTYTNYFGVVTTVTNFALIDLTNNVVTPPTNNFPVRASLSVLGGTSVKVDQVNYYFSQGIWATNSGTGTNGAGGPITVTITYQQ